MDVENNGIGKINVENGLLKLEPSQFKQIMAMIKSPDIENRELVISILEQIDLKKNLGFLLLVYKFLSSRERKEINKASKIFKELGKYMPAKDGIHTFQEIYDVVKIHNPEDIDFFMDQMAEHLEKMLISWGLDFIDQYKLKFVRI